MFTAFLNPFTMIAGGLLVLSPIIIHLINRLRYRRVKWAAMEFVLKSLKKNRRKLIIKQLILLLLRILLVLFVGLLLARYIGSALGFGQPRGTTHVVLLDDTASTGDFWRDGGITKSAFEQAKTAVVEDIVAGAAEAGTPQALEILRVTNPDESFRVERLGSASAAEVKSYLAGLKATAMHADFLPAVHAARRTFEKDSQAKRVLHVVSDFRARDWAGPSAEALAKALPDAVGGKTGNLHLIDTAHPPRSVNRSAVNDHGNIGILDLQPETRLAARYLPVEFTVAVANYTPSSRKNLRVVVRINGRLREDASMPIAEVPPGVTTQTFVASFEDLGINTVTASVAPDEAGLAVDDVRFAAVEVREKVPLLLVTTDAAARGNPAGEGFFLRALFLDAAKGFDVLERGPAELEQPSLERFPAIFLLDVPRLSDKARANLEAYVRGGGGLFVALGPQADTDFYTRWHAEGKGLFPVPVAKATEPLTDAQRFERMFDPALPPKAFVRDDSHPVLARMFRDDRNREVNTYLKFLFVERHVPVPRARWNPDPGAADELFTLPNDRPVDDYKEPAQRLLARLPTDDPRFEKYRDRLREHQRKVKEALAANRPLYALADAIETTLTDRADPAQPEAVNLQEFWSRPDQAALRGDLQRFVESARYGDPLLVSGKYGKGRVMVLTTTAGSGWNDWPSGPARPYWVMLMLESQKFLSGVAPDANRTVGSALEINLDATRYEPRLRRYFLPEVAPDAPTAGPIDKGELAGQPRGTKIAFNVPDAREPGVYRFDLVPKPDGPNATPKAEPIAYAFNVDTAAEGDLRRASRDDLASAAPGMQLHAPGSGLANILKDRKSDLSESPWFYLLILGVLVAEQALAVHLSYHPDGDVTSAVNLATRTVS